MVNLSDWSLLEKQAGALWKSRALWVLILRQTKQHNDFINGVVNFDTE